MLENLYKEKGDLITQIEIAQAKAQPIVDRLKEVNRLISVELHNRQDVVS